MQVREDGGALPDRGSLLRWPRMKLRAFLTLATLVPCVAHLGSMPATAGDFAINWGTAPATWTAGATGPVTITLTDQYGFQLSARMTITRIGGAAFAGLPDDITGFGTATSLGIAWDSNNNSSGVGESTNTATLEFLNGAAAQPVNSLSFIISDIDSTDGNAADDRCDFVTVTGNNGNPTLSYVQPTASLRSVRIGPGTGSGATGALAANQAQCIYNIGPTTSITSNADDNGSVLAVFPNGTSTATVAYDESIENVYGANRNAAARGIGIWSATAVTVNNTISLAKTTTATRYTAAGQVITYTFTVTNNGPLPLNPSQNIQIQDDKIGTFTCGTITSAVASGGTVSCNQNYTVTAADLLAPNITNTAIAGVGTGTQSFATRLQSNSAQAVVPNRVIDAVNDNFSATLINGVAGGTTASVFGNDTLGTLAFANSAVSATITNNAGITGLAINSNGTITVPAGTASGTYTITYQICEVAAPSNCDTATAIIALRPTIRLSKTTVGGTGAFTFTGTNGWASQVITTSVAGTPVSGATQALTSASTLTTITESAVAGYAMTAASCTNASGGSVGTVNLATRTITLTAAETAAGTAITCSVTNTRLPTVTITKISNGGTGPFTFTGTNGWSSQTITTTTSGVGVSGATQTLTAASTATTITETIPTGYVVSAISCTGLGSGAATPNLGAGSVTLNAAATAPGNTVACTFTNTRLPTVTITKISNGGTGPFTFTGTNGWSSQTITTATSGVGVTGATQTLTAASTATTINETIPTGYVVSAISCTGLGSGTATPNLASGSVTLNAAATAPGNAVACTFTNARLPTVTITKISNGDTGSFTFTGTNGLSSQVITTTTSGVGVSGATQTLTAPSTATTITEVIPSGYAVTAISCTGLGSGAATPDLAAGSVTLNAAATAPGANIACTFTNTSLPTIAITKISIGGVGPFTFTGTNGFASQTVTTVTSGVGVTGNKQLLTAASTVTTLTEAVPSGYAMTAASCTNGGGASVGTANLSAATITLSAAETAPGATITCTVTNTRLPTVTITKISNGGTGSFTFTGTNGWASQTISTTTSGLAVSGATQTLTAASVATTITEAIAPGFFLSSVTCSGLGSGGGFTPNLTSGAVVLNAAATAPGATITCTFTNTLAVPQLTVNKSADVASVDSRGDTITYTITVSNTGNVSVTSISVSDPLGTVTCSSSGNATIAALSPLQAETCSFTYTVTQADLDGRGGGDGDIDNTASASGSYGATPVAASGSATVLLVISPALAIDKSSNATVPVGAGDVIVYGYAVTNAGNVTLTGITVNDVHGGSGPFPTPASETLTDNAPFGDSSDAVPGDGVWTTLAPGDVVNFSASYTVTQTDVNNQ